MSSLRPTVLGCYKRLMRARLVAFSGDFNAIEKSRTELRMHFVNNKAAPPEAVVGMVKEMGELEDMLLNGLVQGEVRQSEDEVKVKIELKKGNAESMDKDSINPIEHLGEGLGEEKGKGLDEVKLDKS